MEEMVGQARETAEAEPRKRSGGKHGQQNNCTHHCCGGCGGHFTSLSAFDAHRRGDPDHRYCDTDVTNDKGEPVVVVKSENGTCLLSDPPVIGGAVIWAMRGWQDAAERFREGDKARERAA